MVVRHMTLVQFDATPLVYAKAAVLPFTDFIPPVEMST